MEDQERTEQTPEEEKDVEAHSQKDSHLGAFDEGDDVEGHVLKGSNKDSQKY